MSEDQKRVVIEGPDAVKIMKAIFYDAFKSGVISAMCNYGMSPEQATHLADEMVGQLRQFHEHMVELAVKQRVLAGPDAAARQTPLPPPNVN